jgi:hypothetical protein
LEIPWRRTCGKNITHGGRKDEEGLLVAAECKRTKNTVGDSDIWRRNTEEAWVWASSSAGCRGGGREEEKEEGRRKWRKKKKCRKFLDSLSNVSLL